MVSRLISKGLLSFMLLGVAAAPSLAQDAASWPNKPVRLVVNFGPGGSADNSARPFAERLTKMLGQQFVIENRGGASGALGAEAVMKAAPDGYTYLLTPSLTFVILPHLRKVPFDPLKDFAPVSQITDGTLLVAVHPSLPVNSIQELVAYGKANPGKLNWGTAGVGSFGHIMAESFKLTAGMDLLHVPYRGGGESLADFLAGVFHIHADPNTLPHVAAGKAKLLAVLDRQRHPSYPNVPLLKEIYPELDFLVWFGVFGPAGTPAPIAKKFSEAIAKIASDADLKAQLLKAALTTSPGTPDDLGAAVKKDHARFQALIKKAGIKAE